jgi:pSer/pThr/pTyr-binding forkhead associated (FHA) protein
VAPAAPTSTPSARHPLVDIDGQRYILTGPVTVIGRGSEADIIVDDPGVSRRHLEIKVTPDGVVASDMGSTNGLFVEGHQVPAATLLDGNTLTIGRTRILFWTGGEPDPDE